ncbi:YchJ family protein [Nocardiopsis prasina]|uniref:YchJ family protein n=1 Tax=Nocardiopsis prasina TaxID=2015 RepID=UPI0004778DBC|nr:YchJ family metal-binding protein [Nocardiopsis prasina]
MSKRPRLQPPQSADQPCPCGRTRAYGQCCGRLHDGSAKAATAEDLMRSRYSAFAVGDEAYLLRSWHPDTRPAGVELDPATEWVELEILGTGQGTPFHNEGTVEFRAHYREGGQAGRVHEHSRFLRHDGAWVYLDAL